MTDASGLVPWVWLSDSYHFGFYDALSTYNQAFVTDNYISDLENVHGNGIKRVNTTIKQESLNKDDYTELADSAFHAWAYKIC